MKKTLSVILIALIAMTGLFAANSITGENFNYSEADTKLTLTISATQMESYKIGFTSSGSPDYDDPTLLSDIPLSYTRGGLTSETIGYVFYTIKAASLPTVTLTAGTGLVAKTGHEGDKIAYTITTADGDSASGPNPTGVNLKLVDLTDGVSQGTIGFGITIVEADNVDADFSTTTWSDTIKVSIGSK